MQQIMIGNESKLSCCSQQNQKNVNILPNHSSRIQSDPILLKKLRFHFFLVADTQLYKRLCPSVGPSVRRSVVIELKRGKTSVFDTFCVCLSVGSGFGCGWGLDAPAHPSTTILWPRVTCFWKSLWAVFLAGWASWQQFTESSCNDHFKWTFSERSTVQNFSQIGQIS